MMSILKCPVCGKRFPPKTANARYCSTTCKHRAETERRRKTKRVVGRGCTTGTCRCCGSTFDYYSKDGRPRNICDECRARGYKVATLGAIAAAKNRKPSPSVKKTCLFCGRTFPTRTGSSFCGRCLSARFDQVYIFRKKASNGNWISNGERIMRRQSAP